jgi:hypothetical protein
MASVFSKSWLCISGFLEIPRRKATARPFFPRLPQAPLKALCKADGLCEKCVHEPLAQGLQDALSSTGSTLGSTRVGRGKQELFSALADSRLSWTTLNFPIPAWRPFRSFGRLHFGISGLSRLE